MLEEALAVEFAVGAAVGVASGREQVGRDVAHGSDVGHDLYLFVDRWELSEELRVRVALEDLCRDGAAGGVCLRETVRVRLVEEDLCLQHVRRGPGDFRVLTEREVQEHLHRGPALHVGEKLQRKGRRDLVDVHCTRDDVLEKARLHSRSTRGARERVVDEELQRVRPMLVIRVHDLCNQCLDQRRVFDGLGVQPLVFAGVDLLKVLGVKAHRFSDGVWFLGDYRHARPN